MCCLGGVQGRMEGLQSSPLGSQRAGLGITAVPNCLLVTMAALLQALCVYLPLPCNPQPCHGIVGILVSEEYASLFTGAYLGPGYSLDLQCH